jgi:hypothetical protein
MKKNVILLLLISVVIYSCKKNEVSEPTIEEILNKKINEIIPQKYLDTLKRLGLVVNTGTTPPNVEGIYVVAPHKMANSNIPNDYYWNHDFSDAKVKFTDQSIKDFGIKLFAKNYLAANDTSIVTAISGNGNDFTVYGKVKAVAANNLDYIIVGVIISGTKDGTAIKKLKTGLINIDASKDFSNGTFILEGQGRIAYDSDNISESSLYFRGSEPINSPENFITTKK